MFNDYNKEFQFLINVSREAYQKKEDARACLVYAGAKAIQRNKMAFVQKDMTVPLFLDLATTGHTFCNLFSFDPKKEYWIKNSKGQSYQSYPIYYKGENKGAMKIQFKSDKYFHGSQAVFVDVDYTSYKTVPEYLAKLSMQPTCVYMSFSDGIEKQKTKSRRFRLVYVFDEILDQKKFLYVSKSINDQIVADTGEDMEDDCGTRMSQYMNGVYGNNETYEFDWVYSPSDFCVSGDYTIKPYIEEETPEPEPEDDPMKFDNQMLNDMESMEYKTFMHLYSTRYKYIYRTEKDVWEDGLYQFTDENYLQLYYYREKVKDGEHRRKKLFWAACLRRLINPEIDPNTLLFNLYIDRERFYDNSDEVMSIACLTRRVRKAFEMTYEELQRFCGATVAYWKANRPYFIFRPGVIANYGNANHVMKLIRYKELDVLYDRSISLKENIEMGLTVPLSTLYRYCADRMIDTKPNRTMTAREQERQQKRDLKQEKIELFQKLYDPNKSTRQNKEFMAENGLNISKGTIDNWRKLYYNPDMSSRWGEICVPEFSLDFLPKEDEPNDKEVCQYEKYNWEFPPLYMETDFPTMCFS